MCGKLIKIEDFFNKQTVIESYLTHAGASPDRTSLIHVITCFGVPSCSSASYLYANRQHRLSTTPH